MADQSSAAGSGADPLHGSIPDSVPLRDAPLVRVIGRVQFKRIIKIEEDSYIANFQEAIRDKYPGFDRALVSGIDVSVSNGVMQSRPAASILWRMSDIENSFRVVLGADAIMLETDKYTSRGEFLSRFDFVLKCFSDNVQLSPVETVSVRYIDRLSDEDDISALPVLINSELVNVLQSDLIDSVEASMTDIVAETEEGKINVQFGLAPPSFTHAPDLVQPIDKPSWIFDVNSRSTGCDGKEFDAETLGNELAKAAARAYAFFRWSVTDQFLERFGRDKNRRQRHERK